MNNVVEGNNVVVLEVAEERNCKVKRHEKMMLKSNVGVVKIA